MIDIAISIVNYNTKNLVKQCVRNIIESPLPLSCEIIITDNNSSDGSAELIKKEILPHYKNVRLIASRKNRGFGAGHNFGLKEGLKNEICRYVLIMNADIVLLKDALYRLFQFIEEDEGRAIVGPQLLYADLTLQRSCHAWPRFITPLYRRTRFCKTSFGRREIARYDLKHYDFKTPRKVDWMIGACLLIRKNFWDDVNGFDERYFMYYEDVDLCKTAWKKGYEVWYFPPAQMIHYHKRHSAKQVWWGSVFNKTARIHIASHLKYFKKWKQKNSL